MVQAGSGSWGVKKKKKKAMRKIKKPQTWFLENQYN